MTSLYLSSFSNVHIRRHTLGSKVEGALQFRGNRQGALMFLKGMTGNKHLIDELRDLLRSDTYSVSRYSDGEVLSEAAGRLADGRLYVEDKFKPIVAGKIYREARQNKDTNPNEKVVKFNNFKRRPRPVVESAPAPVIESSAPKPPKSAQLEAVRPTATQADIHKPNKQVEALLNAAANATPFCEVCAGR